MSTPLPWPLTRTIPTSTELSLLPLLLKWPNEVGSFCYQPSFRLPPIIAACNQLSIPLHSALSLRRHHIKARNKHLHNHQLRMGTDHEKKMAADAFERVVERYLQANGVNNYQTQEQQVFVNPPIPGVKHPGTPDFLFSPPLQVLDPATNAVRSLHWLEVKHFYGASTIKPGKTSACGQIPAKTLRYYESFGPGAMLFAYGCGEDLVKRMPEEVVVLDESVLVLDEVAVQIAKFCARREDGMLLP